MPPEKKPESKSESKPGGKESDHKEDPFVEIVWLFIALFIAVYALNAIFNAISNLLSGNLAGNGLVEFFQSLLKNILPYLKFFAVIFSVICIFCITYLFRKIMHLAREENKKLYPEGYLDNKVDYSAGSVNVNPQWERILNHIESLNENDWRLAILEADIMLAGIVDTLQLPGDTIGDKLKAVEKSDFTTVDMAWEAHKIRNQIAHEGISFNLNQREARRVIELYRTVFEEFRVI